MIKTSKGKKQSTTVVHEGKVYKGVMPNLNMKTDLTDSFEYIATVVEGMSSGNMNGNPVFEDFKKKIVNWTISGEVGKLINERGHVPENYEPSPHLGRFSSQVGLARDMQTVPNSEPVPLTNLPREVGKATDLLAEKMSKKKEPQLEEAIQIDVGANIGDADTSMMMEKLQQLFDEWEEMYPSYKTFNKTITKQIMDNIKREASEEKKKTTKKKAVKKTKKKIAKKKTTKKRSTKKVTKKRSNKKD